MAGAFPADFELIEDPFHMIGPRRAPFDDEGTPTRVKTLLKGPERVESISDLQTAAASGSRPTGNGFRRGTFLSHPSECVPVTCPSQLRLKAGTTPLKDVLKDLPEIVWVESISMPFSQIMDASQTKDVWTVKGKFLQSGRPAAQFVETRFTGRPIISAYPPGSHGSLLDRNSVILADGEQLESGWYPYILVPVVRW